MRKLFQYCHFLYYFCISSFTSRLVLVSFKSNMLLVVNSMPSIHAPSFIFVVSDYFKRTANILLNCMPISSLFVFWTNIYKGNARAEMWFFEHASRCCCWCYVFIFLVSDLSDLVEMIHLIVRLMENLQARGTLRVSYAFLYRVIQ